MLPKQPMNPLVKSGINFVACLPDSAFQELYLPLSADPKITYVQVASENDGVGVCMGAWLGGMKPALLVENTGFTSRHLRSLARADGVWRSYAAVDQPSG